MRLGQIEIEREEALLRAAGSERDREGGGLVACGLVCAACEERLHRVLRIGRRRQVKRR